MTSFQPAGSNLTPTDRNWVGAWWIGFLLGAGLLLLPVVPLLGFGKQFPNAKQVQESKKECEDTIEERDDLKHDFRSAWPATKALLKNAPFLLICLASASESLAIGGFSTFIPKLIETQFHFTSSNAALYTGFIVIPGAAGGIFLGGYLPKRFNWNCSTTLKGASVMAFIATLTVLTSLIGCDSRTVVGTDENYFNRYASNHPLPLFVISVAIKGEFVISSERFNTQNFDERILIQDVIKNYVIPDNVLNCFFSDDDKQCDPNFPKFFLF